MQPRTSPRASLLYDSRNRDVVRLGIVSQVTTPALNRLERTRVNTNKTHRDTEGQFVLDAGIAEAALNKSAGRKIEGIGITIVSAPKKWQISPFVLLVLFA